MEQTFEQYIEQPRLDERFVNLFIKDKAEREKWVDKVWDVLQASYKKIDGIKGNGFKNKKDMIDNIPFWKIGQRNGEVLSVAMYKDKGGRKRVAMGAKKAPGAKVMVADMMAADLKFKRSWGEISGRAWGFLKKNTPPDVLKAALLPVSTVKKLQPGKEIIPAYGVDPDIKANDEFRDFWYIRKLTAKGGKPSTKIAIGNPGNSIG